MNLLLADDEALALKTLEKAVKKAIPYGECHVFSVAEDAMAFSDNNNVDIAFLDINMPVISGLDMAKAIMDKHPKANIIFCTGYDEYAVEAFKMYSSGYLLKPVSEDDILEAMEHLRYPVENKKRIYLQCFGNFEAFCDG